MQRHPFRLCPLGRDVMNFGRVHRDSEVRWVNDETVLALAGAFGVVERPGKLDDPGPFPDWIYFEVFGKAGGFGVEEEEHKVTL